MRATSIGRRAPGDNKPADAILLFEFPEQFLGGAAHADAAENAEFGHRQIPCCIALYRVRMTG